MSRIATKRLQKVRSRTRTPASVMTLTHCGPGEQELSDLQTKGCPTGCRVIQAENLEEWIIALRVLGETVYDGEEFALVSQTPRPLRRVRRAS